jgi:hypothetical protein
VGILRATLLPRGYLAFILDREYAEKQGKIGIIKGTDQFEILRFMSTSGNDFPISNEEIIAQIKEWEKRCSFDIMGAYYDWLEIWFKTLPEDVESLASEVESICPNDSLMPTKESVAIIAKELRKGKRLFLWWD